MKRSALAVLIPVFNNQAGLARSLASLVDETIPFDVVIVDDGSLEPICAPTELAPCRPVQLFRLEKNRGIAGALNHGLQSILANSYRYVARLDAGDTVVHGRLALQEAFMESHPECAAVSSFVDFVDPAGNLLFRYLAPTTHDRIMRRMHLNNCMVHSGAMLRSSALQTFGPYDEAWLVTEDYELFLRLGTRSKLAVLPEVLTRCEYNVGGLSVTRRRTQQIYRLKLQIRYFDPWALASYYGVLRTLAALAVPHSFVFYWKRRYGRGFPQAEAPRR